MTNFQTVHDPLPHIPDNLTITQFMLDYQHDMQPIRNSQMACLVDDHTGRTITFEMLKTQTADLANGLFLKYKIGEQDTVLIFSPNHIHYPVALWAIHKLGGVVSFSNPQFKADEVAYQLRTAHVTYLVSHSSLISVALEAMRLAGIPSNRIIVLDEVPTSRVGVSQDFQNVHALIAYGRRHVQAFYERQLEPGEGKMKTAILCWSSGTTGKPKAIAIAHYALIANIIQLAVHQQVNKPPSQRANRSFRPGDVASVLPFYHVAGLVIGLHLTVFCAMTLVVFQAYNFPSLLESIFRHKITHLILVPPIAVSFCKHPAARRYNYKNIKFVMIGAAPVPQAVQEQLISIFPNAHLGQAYGLTEMTTALTMVSGGQKRGPLGSSGRLLPGIRARVIKADGTPARSGERGELVVQGPAIALGYLNDIKATRETFRDGWVHTGDEVAITADQEVFVFDRLKEFLKVKGMQVSPSELEDCLLSHSAVAEACVVGIPDEYHGEVPLGYVTLTPEARDCLGNNSAKVNQLTDSILRHVVDRKANYKHLRGGLRYIDEIPKNASGKILRRVLRQEARLNPLIDSEKVKL